MFIIQSMVIIIKGVLYLESEIWNLELLSGGFLMVKVKTFSIPIRVFHVHEELEALDDQVNEFLARDDVKKVISVSDAVTTDDKGTAIGLVRVVTYKARDKEKG
jgi:hypothetical protein